jgi:histidinol-phosphatase (PHP family)
MAGTVQTDYHMHSKFSLDGHNTPQELCRQALALGLTQIAITDHVEWVPGGQHQRPDFDHYFAVLEQSRREFGPHGLTIYSGLELGNPHQHRAEVDALLGGYPFDVVVASLHWLDGINIHYTGCFDRRDPTEVYAAYFTEFGAIAATVACDVLAHFDRIFWPGSQLDQLPDLRRLERTIRTALAQVATHGRVLELNTRFLTYAPGWNDLLLTVLTWFRQEGGTHVAVNSDAHRISEVGRNRDLGQSIVQAAGFAGSAVRDDWKAARG